MRNWIPIRNRKIYKLRNAKTKELPEIGKSGMELEWTVWKQTTLEEGKTLKCLLNEENYRMYHEDEQSRKCGGHVVESNEGSVSITS